MKFAGKEYIEMAQRVIADCSSQETIVGLEQVLNILNTTLCSGNAILCCGNGGSAADASHFAAELVCRFEKERSGKKAISLGTDSQIITAIANDYAFERIFSRQIESVGSPGDALIIFTTSGASLNCICAAEEAIKQGMKVIVFTGAQGGNIELLADVVIRAKSKRTSHIQEAHRVMYHLLCMWLEAADEGVEFENNNSVK